MIENEYLPVSEALTRILADIDILPAERVPIGHLLGRVLASPIVALHDMPPFANSAMDGYAVLSGDLVQASLASPVSLKVIGEVAAGTLSHQVIEPGLAIRITTGAPMPKGADSVIPVEHTNEPWRGKDRPLPDRIEIYRSTKPGDAVRYPGEDVQKNSVVLKAGQVIRPQEVGLLAALGHATAEVIRQPKIAVLATGDELVDVGEPLGPGKIRNSNSYTQSAQIIEAGGQPILLGIAVDTLESVRERLLVGIEEGADLLVTSAGVSVGAYDVVKTLLSTEGEIKFWRVRMRPGKPLTYGLYQSVPFLGLPGNPVSAMVSFERFVRPAIRKMAGFRNVERSTIEVKMKDGIHSDGRESYIRVQVVPGSDGYWATTTGGQGSHILTSLVKANALVIVPEGTELVKPGTKLTAIMIDWPSEMI